MDGQTSIGPAEPAPPASGDAAQPATVEGVDAQDVNALDMRRGLAGAEAKPFAGKPAGAPPRSTKPAEPDDHEASASQPDGDPNEADPDARGDMITERRDPGRHGGGGDPGWKPSR